MSLLRNNSERRQHSNPHSQICGNYKPVCESSFRSSELAEIEASLKAIPQLLRSSIPRVDRGGHRVQRSRDVLHGLRAGMFRGFCNNIDIMEMNLRLKMSSKRNKPPFSASVETRRSGGCEFMLDVSFILFYHS